MEVKIIEEKLDIARADSFWYYGENIAEITLDDGISFVAMASGSIEMFFDEDGSVYKGANAVQEALNRDLTDDDLSALGIQDRILLGNWFNIVQFDDKNEAIDGDFAICHDYDEAIQMLKDVAKEYKNKK